MAIATVREILEKINGAGLAIVNWKTLEEYLEKELTVFLDESYVVNYAQLSEESKKEVDSQ